MNNPNSEMSLMLKKHETKITLPVDASTEACLSAALTAMGLDPDKIVEFMKSDIDPGFKDILLRCVSFNDASAMRQGIFDTKPWKTFFKNITATP